MRFRKDRRAFTIVELVIVIAVIAILVSAPLGGFLIDFTYKKLLTIGEEKWNKFRLYKLWNEKIFLDNIKKLQ